MKRSVFAVTFLNSELNSRLARLLADEDDYTLVDLALLSRSVTGPAFERALEEVLSSSERNLVIVWDHHPRQPSRCLYQWLHENRAHIEVLVSLDEEEVATPVARAPRRTISGKEDLASWIVNNRWTTQTTERPDLSVTEIAVPVEAARKAATSVLCGEGLDQRAADLVVSDLLQADRHGYASHGIARVFEYASKLRQGIINGNPHPSVRLLGDDRIILDADRGIGALTKKRVVELISNSDGPLTLVAVVNTGHLGRLSSMIEDIVLAGRLVLCMVNCAGGSQKVAPYGGAEARLATNPIAFGCPVPGGAPVIVDVATSAVSDGYVRLAAQTGERVIEGALTSRTDASPRVARRYVDDYSVSLRPLGGAEHGHKGYALGLMVEIMAGIFAGGGFSQPGKVTSGNAALIIAFDIDAMGQESSTALANIGRLAAYIRSCPPSTRHGAVRLPGERSASDIDSHIVLRRSIWDRLQEAVHVKRCQE